MPATWTPAFDFYLATKSGDRVFQRIDLEARQHAPVSTHPLALFVDVTMSKPRDDGLRSEEETDELFDYEAALVHMVEDLVDGIFWGLRMINGICSFQFSVPPGEGADIVRTLAPILDIPGYRPTVRIAQDPTWTHYADAFPGDFHRQTMYNRGVQLALEEAGDSLKKRRRIDHSTIFPSAEEANRAVPGLRRAKFRGFSISESDGDGTVLTFQRRDACDGNTPNDTMTEILDIVEPLGGSYDGWGCLAQK